MGEFKKGIQGDIYSDNIYIGSEQYNNKVVTKKDLRDFDHSVIVEEASVSIPVPKVSIDLIGKQMLVYVDDGQDAINKIFDSGYSVTLYLFRVNHSPVLNFQHPVNESIATGIFKLTTEYTVVRNTDTIFSVGLIDFMKPFVYVGAGGASRAAPTTNPWYEIRFAGSSKAGKSVLAKRGKVSLSANNFYQQYKNNNFEISFAYVVKKENKTFVGPLSYPISFVMKKGTNKTGYDAVTVKIK